MMTKNETFASWLSNEIESGRWRSIREFAREADVSAVAIINIINEVRRPGPRVCRAIARVLKRPPEEIFRRAGLLPPQPPRDDNFEAALFLFRQLSEEDQEKMLAFIQTLVEIQAKKP